MRTGIDRPFLIGFLLAVAAAVAYNALSIHRAFFDPGCADCVRSAGVPFAFVEHGGFFTTTEWHGRPLRDSVAAITVSAVLSGFATRVALRDRGRQGRP